MKINGIESSQNFGSIYKVRATAQNIKQFDEAAAPLYRSLRKKGIRAFVRNTSEMYAMTGKDAYEFDRKYNFMIRNKVGRRDGVSLRKPEDNVISLSAEYNNFMNDSNNVNNNQSNFF